jgi:hypothetical protein
VRLLTRECSAFCAAGARAAALLLLRLLLLLGLLLQLDLLDLLLLPSRPELDAAIGQPQGQQLLRSPRQG